MNDRIEAIYENGVFRPLGEVSLPEHFQVVLRIEKRDIRGADDAEVIARQKRAAALLDARLEQIPDNSPDDGFSSEDHDRILYGGQS
jgi:predicted DNA-binding antitoxin AbrB/MazE fold protein